MFTVEMSAPELQRFMQQWQSRMNNMSALNAIIATELYNQTVKNFEANGRPAWAGLSPKTLAKRAKLGIGGENILRVKGKLFDAIKPFSDAHVAGIGVANTVPYAAVHQFGGVGASGHAAPIPARPYLPLDKDDNLQPEAEEAIIGVVTHYLRQIGA